MTGTDVSDGMVAEVRARGRRGGLAALRFERMDAEALTFPDGSFDRVL